MPPFPKVMGMGPLGCLAVCALLISGCDDHEKVCRKCSAAFVKEKRVSHITHYDGKAIDEEYFFYYDDMLVDSIVKISYSGAGARVAAGEIVTSLKVHYPEGECIPSYYVARTYDPSSPVSVEKAFMSVSGDVINNKHLAYYPDEEFPVVDDTDEIDYLYDASDRVTTRKGTDYGVMVFPNPYGNENFYTYTGNNISHIVAQKEQAGYTLDIVFDANRNPFSIQNGVMYYLSLIAYTDEEYFETICQDRNNPTQIVYHGTDTSNSFVTITFTFTYSYDGDNYPTEVSIFEAKEDEVYGNTETDHGSYVFEYY